MTRWCSRPRATTSLRTSSAVNSEASRRLSKVREGTHVDVVEIDAASHGGVGIVLNDLGQHQAACEAYREALAIAPDVPDGPPVAIEAATQPWLMEHRS